MLIDGLCADRAFLVVEGGDLAAAVAAVLTGGGVLGGTGHAFFSTHDAKKSTG